MELFHVLGPYLDRQTWIRTRATCRNARDLLMRRQKIFPRLDTSPFAKIKMVLNLGKWPMGGVTVRTRPDGLKEVHVRYRDTEFTFEYMVQTFAFMESVTARMFFMAYKFREYDSKLIDFEVSARPQAA